MKIIKRSTEQMGEFGVVATAVTLTQVRGTVFPIKTSKEFDQLLLSKHLDVHEAESEQEQSKHGKAEHRPGLAGRDRRHGGGRQHYPNNGEVAGQERRQRTQNGGVGGRRRVLAHPADAGGYGVGADEDSHESKEQAELAGADGGADAQQHDGEADGRHSATRVAAHRLRRPLSIRAARSEGVQIPGKRTRQNHRERDSKERMELNGRYLSEHEAGVC
jgi:hypothetical protein